MVEPAVDPVARAVASDNLRGLRIDVVPRSVRVVEARKNDRQWTFPASIQVVPVVLLEHTQLRATARLRGLRDEVDNPMAIELGPRFSVHGNNPGLASGQSGQVDRFSGERGQLELFDPTDRHLPQSLARMFRGKRHRLSATSTQRMWNVRS